MLRKEMFFFKDFFYILVPAYITEQKALSKSLVLRWSKMHLF